MSEKRFEFRKIKIAALELPESGKRATYYDTKVPRLALRVTSSGAKTFYVIKRVGGEVVWLKLGVFPDMTAERARDEAGKIIGQFAHGQNPAEARRASKQELTFGDLFKEFGKRHGKAKRSWKTDQSIYANHLEKPLSARKLAEVNRTAISHLLSGIKGKGLSDGTVNNVRALVSSIFGRAIEWGYVDSNPVAGIKTRPKVRRDRFLQSAELPAFFKAVAEEPNATMRDYVLLALLTGARRANLQEMRWADVSLSESVWRIPRTKNGTPQNVTLSPEAVTILESRQPENGDKAVYVFPGDGDSGHLAEPKKAVIRIMKRAGIPYGRNKENGVTLHDLRRTLGSWQAKTGASLAIIGKSLNHQSQQTTAIYARLDLDPVRAAVNTATAAMMEAGGMKKPAEVRQLRKGAAR